MIIIFKCANAKCEHLFKWETFSRIQDLRHTACVETCPNCKCYQEFFPCDLFKSFRLKCVFVIDR